jgi:DNA-binding transcriptional ArsR family regulator
MKTNETKEIGYCRTENKRKNKRGRKFSRKTIELEKSIMKEISKAGELTGFKTIKYTGGTESNVRKLLKKLVETGRLECEERGQAKYYSLPKGQHTKVEGEAPLGERGAYESLGCGAQ